MRRSTGYSMNGRSLAVTSFRGTSNRMSQTASAANTSMPSSRVLRGTMSRSARQYTAAPLANMSAASEARSRNALDMLSRIHIRTSSSDTDMIRSTRINMVGTDPAGTDVSFLARRIRCIIRIGLLSMKTEGMSMM